MLRVKSFFPLSYDFSSLGPPFPAFHAPKHPLNGPKTLRSTLTPHPSTLTPHPSTLNAQRSTLNAQRSTLNSQRSTLNAQPSTLNPQRSTLNPQRSPLTPHPSARRLRRLILQEMSSAGFVPTVILLPSFFTFHFSLFITAPAVQASTLNFFRFSLFSFHISSYLCSRNKQ